MQGHVPSLPHGASAQAQTLGLPGRVGGHGGSSSEPPNLDALTTVRRIVGRELDWLAHIRTSEPPQPFEPPHRLGLSAAMDAPQPHFED